MQCPRCLQHFFSKPRRVDLGACGEDQWAIWLETCPNCNDAIISLSRLTNLGERSLTMVRPRALSRPPLPPEIPESLTEDYREASALLADSPKASAALGRRCLRNLLHQFGFRAADLNTEIDTLIASRHLPHVMAEWLDAVRQVGRFDVNPTKSRRPDEIQAAEPGEAEVILDALDGLFQYYFVVPAEMEKKRMELLARLNVAWKNAM